MAGEEADPSDEDRHRPRNDEEVERDEMWELCSRHLEALASDRDKLIAIYFYQRDLDGNEIAKELSIKVDEVRAALQRIRRTILAAARAE